MNQEAIHTRESLHKNTIVLLYLNLIGNIWGLITVFGKFNNLSYKQFLHDEISLLLDFSLIVIGSVTFFNTFVAIHNLISSSIRLLWASMVLCLLDAFYMIYGLVQMHSNDHVREIIHITRQKEVAKVIQVERSSYWFPIESFSTSMLVVVVSLVIGLAFKLYSALIFHIYKLLLQRRPDSSAIVLRNDSSAPSVYTVQFADPHCMSQSAQYFNQNASFTRNAFPRQHNSRFKTPQYYFQPRLLTHVPFHTSQFPSNYQTPEISSSIADQPQYSDQSTNVESGNPN